MKRHEILLLVLLISCNGTEVKKSQYLETNIKKSDSIKAEINSNDSVSICGKWKLIKVTNKYNKVYIPNKSIVIEINLDSAITKTEDGKNIYYDTLNMIDSFIFEFKHKSHLSINWSPYKSNKLVLRQYEFEGDLEYYERY